ncbi:MAG: hypothetical protein ACFB0C_18585 [Leptolyngbyaceae cyanobacterium]
MKNLSEWQPEPGLNQYVAVNLNHPSESLILHQMAQQVRAEIQHREAFNRYCEWYAAIALEHQQDLEKMQAEPQLLTWSPKKQATA